jgi:mono/diheme cytochrome c family protein
MPTFGFTPEQAQELTQWFAIRAGQEWPFTIDPDPQPDGELLAAGQERFESLQCNSCHPAGGVNPSNPDPANWGPDLAMADERLHFDWIGEWLRDPPSLQPGTKMPSFFGETLDGEYNAFTDDWEQAIRELQHYLWHMELAEDDGGDAVSMAR